MPAVTMRRRISGKRNGRDWPKPGETIDVPGDEARTLVRLGLAETDQAEPAAAEADEPNEEQSEDDPAADDEADGEPADEADEDDESEPADETDGLDSMKLPELRELAAERGLPTSGNKPALIERLRGE